MKPSSAKAKGRVACKLVQELLYKYAPELEPGDIEVTSSGVTGEDLKMSPAARRIYPIVCEVKNQENISIWACLSQAESHKHMDDARTPVLFFRRNRSGLYAALPAEDLIRILTRK